MIVAHHVDTVHIGHEDTEDLELRGGYSGEGNEDVKVATERHEPTRRERVVDGGLDHDVPEDSDGAGVAVVERAHSKLGSGDDVVLVEEEVANTLTRRRWHV